MTRLGHLLDEDLLAAAVNDVDAFGVFYERHERAVGNYFMRRTRDAHLAADLTSETFAAAFVGLRGFRGDAPAVGWLFVIARNTLLRSLKRQSVDDSARRRLGLRVEVDDEMVRAFEALAGDEVASAWLSELPEDQAAAVRHRVLEDASYDEVARQLLCSPSLARQRVSRGLRALRAREENR